jgi:hypothetical protein
MTRRLLTVTLSLVIAACTPTGVDDVTSESWGGDIGSTGVMMMMTIAHRGTSVSGSGGFTALLVPGSAQSYTISGARRADTLDLLFKRTGEEVRFVGHYNGPSRVGLSGTISGGDYSGTTIFLRKQR